MKRLLIILCILLQFASTACADAYFKFNAPVTPGMYDRDVALYFSREHSGPDGQLILLDADGNELASIHVRSKQKNGWFPLHIDESMPLGQKVQMYFQNDGEIIFQDECILGADAPKHDGIRRVDTEKKKIAITFDTATGTGKTLKLLDLLDKYGVSCTFFVQGEFALSHPDLVYQIDAKGHELGNHSMYHPDMREISLNRIYHEIAQCNEVIENIIGKPVKLYRPPSGYYTYRDRGISRALEMEMILWTFDSHDGFYEEEESTIWRIMERKSEPGAIILMHVYGRYTLPILNKYIPEMQQAGYEFVTVSSLLKDEGDGLNQ